MMLIQVMCSRFDLVEPYIEDQTIHFVLLQNGVYLIPQLLSIISPERISVIDADWLASGLAHQSLLKGKPIQRISIEQWVTLCTEHSSIMTIQ